MIQDCGDNLRRRLIRVLPDVVEHERRRAVEDARLALDAELAVTAVERADPPGHEMISDTGRRQPPGTTEQAANIAQFDRIALRPALSVLLCSRSAQGQRGPILSLCGAPAALHFLAGRGLGGVAGLQSQLVLGDPGSDDGAGHRGHPARRILG